MDKHEKHDNYVNAEHEVNYEEDASDGNSEINENDEIPQNYH